MKVALPDEAEISIWEHHCLTLMSLSWHSTTYIHWNTHEQCFVRLNFTMQWLIIISV